MAETRNEAGDEFLSKEARKRLAEIRAEMIATNPVFAAIAELNDEEPAEETR